MKKKVISIALVGALVVSMGALAGCGQEKEKEEVAEAADAVIAEEEEEEVEEAEPEEAEVSEEAEEASAAGSEGDYNTDYAGTTITLLIDTDTTDAGLLAVCDLAEEKLGITVDVSYRVGGDDGDNLVKTQLSSGEMADICAYNSGALLSALNPTEYFYDLSGDSAIMDRLDDTYASTVTVNGETFGVPLSSSQAGAVMYNKDIYEEYGLEVPTTWDEFIANCDVLKDAGETAVLGTFSDSWTTQVIFLGDNANVMAYDPEFAADLTDGTDNYEDNEYALRSWEKTAQLNEYYNSDYLATTYDDGCDMIVEGDAAQWIILTQALSNIYELYGDEVNNIGVFAVPADDAEDTMLTTWMPTSLYANKNAENLDAVIAFLEFYVSDEALDCYTNTILPDGPYCIKGYELPDNAYDAVKEDMQAYFDDSKTGLAMEFLTDVKGSNCPAICQECGSGQTTALEAAEKYDDDCKLQAQQLGYEWAQ